MLYAYVTYGLQQFTVFLELDCQEQVKAAFKGIVS
jgi:hypothetical protein